MVAPQNNSKARKLEITEHLRQSHAVEARFILEYVGIMVEESRSALVYTDSSDFARKQGEAQAWDRLHKALTIGSSFKENR